MEENKHSSNAPPEFRCPISIEVMKDPVTISTGITYERRHIERWLFDYKKKSCPTTMQPLVNFDLTPNLTLKSLILTWEKMQADSPKIASSSHEEIVSLLKNIESSPFKVRYLKNLRAIMEVADDETKLYFIRSGGVQVAVQIMVQILLPEEGVDFTTFVACEEALGLLHVLQLSDDDHTLNGLLSKPESMKAMSMMLQRGSSEARLYVVTAFRQMSIADRVDWKPLIKSQDCEDVFRSLIELVSDDVSCKASYRALQVLISILASSKTGRLKAIECGIISVLVELLSDSSISDTKCEKILLLIKLLCEFAEGRMALTEHALGIAALSQRLMKGTHWETKTGLKILWLIATNCPSKRALEEMLMYGAVKKFLTLLHVDGRSSMKDKIIKIFKLHSNFWDAYPCFSLDFSFSIVPQQ
ncbi:hypothetical protein ACFE04_017593 [Oxalis oulophora]